MMSDYDCPTDAEVRETIALYKEMAAPYPKGFVPALVEITLRLAHALLAARERISGLKEGLDKERALGDALAMVVKREKRQVYDRVQATAVPHALHGCCCPSCHIGRLLDLYAEARNA